MQENEKNCPRCYEHPGQQLEIANFGEPAVSDFQYTTPTGEISRFLLRGQKNAVSLRQLEALTGWNGRTVRLMIQRERLNGVPILADNQSGYFLPATQEEQKQCVRSMRHRAKEILKTATSIEKAGSRGEE